MQRIKNLKQLEVKELSKIKGGNKWKSAQDSCTGGDYKNDFANGVLTVNVCHL